MNESIKHRYEMRAQIVKALAHPARLQMLDLLQDGERCVCELTEQVGLDQSTVSKHLSLLRQVGIVTDRKEGAKTFYSLCCPCLQGFWKCIEGVLQKRIETQQAAMEFRP